MSQSDYIKYKKTSTELKSLNKYPPVLHEVQRRGTAPGMHELLVILRNCAVHEEWSGRRDLRP